VVDESGIALRIGWLRLLFEASRAVLLRVGCAALGAAARVACARTAPPLRRAEGRADGPVVLVVPVLPDTSHTFVYREALALLAARPTWRCVVLAAQTSAPRHREAEALAARSVFLPRSGVAARLLRIAKWLLTSRGRELFSIYRAAEGGSCAALLHKRALADGREPGNAFELAELLRPMRPRHVHVYSSTHPTNVAMGAAHLLGVPFSISSYVDFEFDYSHKLLAEKFARATFFRVVSQFCCSRMLEILALEPNERLRLPVVDFGIDLAAWPERVASPARGALLSVARLVPKKGLHLVPRVLQRLRREGVSVTWAVIGDGPERARIANLCRQCGVDDLVAFHGAKDSDAVRAILQCADIALLPCVMVDDGERDGIPVFLAEAMAVGVPVVTTPVAGIPELVEHGSTGFMCAPGDEAALAALLDRLLREPTIARSVVPRARAKVEAKFNVRATSAQLLARIEA
jgi:glycosyltransferase involved in cell wall biosynthesis